MSWPYADKPEMTQELAASHPAGTYLAAATTFAILFKQSPVGLSYRAGLDDETAQSLQEVAWETVQEFFNP